MNNVFQQGSWKVPSSASAELRQYDVSETVSEIQELVSHLYKLGAITAKEYSLVLESFQRLQLDYQGDK